MKLIWIQLCNNSFLFLIQLILLYFLFISVVKIFHEKLGHDFSISLSILKNFILESIDSYLIQVCVQLVEQFVAFFLSPSIFFFFQFEKCILKSLLNVAWITMIPWELCETCHNQIVQNSRSFLHERKNKKKMSEEKFLLLLLFVCSFACECIKTVCRKFERIKDRAHFY